MIDLRSDTVTMPTQAMKEFAFNAPLGDDVYGEDPSINDLQNKISKLFNKEAALFVPSGTMANSVPLESILSKQELVQISGFIRLQISVPKYCKNSLAVMKPEAFTALGMFSHLILTGVFLSSSDP